MTPGWSFNEIYPLPPGTWVVVRHPGLHRGEQAIPIAVGKFTFHESFNARTDETEMLVTLEGRLPPARLRRFL